MDNLEKYIRDNQAAFDTETPRQTLWTAIENSLPIADDVEEFVSNNRPAFDTETPKTGIWAAIEKSLIETNIEKFVVYNRDAFDTEIPTSQIWTTIEKDLSEHDLEKFVKHNRDAFDTEIPSLHVWATVEKRVNPQPMNKVVRMNWLRQAAAAIALLIVGTVFGFYLNTKKADVIVANTTENIAPELNEAEDFYTKKVESQYAQLARYNPDPSVLADLKQIDEVQQELKKELENAPNSTKEDITHRLIENYHIKLGILERVLKHIKEVQKDDKSNNQKLQKQHEKI